MVNGQEAKTSFKLLLKVIWKPAEVLLGAREGLATLLLALGWTWQLPGEP